MNKRIKVRCRHCGKPFFLIGLPIVSLTYLKGGKIRIERISTTTSTYKVTYDGIVCSYKCNRYARLEGIRVLNYPKAVSMTEARRIGA